MKCATKFVVLITIMSLGTYAVADLSTGLMAHWEMEETSGAVASDSANSWDLSPTDGFDISSATTTGIIGNGFYFDTTSARLSQPDLWDTTIPAAITVAGWLKPMEGLSSTAGWFQKQPGAPYDQLQLWCNAGGTYTAKWRNDSADGNATAMTTLNSGVAVVLDQWTHVAFTWDASGAAIYINGEVKGTSTEPMMTAAGGVDMMLGSGNYHLNPFTGVMDDVRIYERALTSEEIATLGVPEPTTLVLLSLGGLLLRKRK